MNKKITSLITAALMLICITPAVADTRATPRTCVTAIMIAKNHGDIWQERAFTLEDCKAIAEKLVESELDVDQDSAQRHYYYEKQDPYWCCFDAPGYVSRNGFYHHYHLQ